MAEIEVVLRLDAEWWAHIARLAETREDGETFEVVSVTTLPRT
jgi:hypothetical protein